MQALSFFAALTGSLPKQGMGDGPAPQAGLFGATLDAAVHETHGPGPLTGETHPASETGDGQSENSAEAFGPFPGLFRDLQVVETSTGWGFAFASPGEGVGVGEGAGPDQAAGPEPEAAATVPPGLGRVVHPGPEGLSRARGVEVTVLATTTSEPMTALSPTRPGGRLVPPVSVPEASPAPGAGEELPGVRPGVSPTPVASTPAPTIPESMPAAATTYVEGPEAVSPVDDGGSAGTSPDPDRDLKKLAPELLTRLQRVVDRMYTEHGHRVELVEGYRSQERQDLLFAQGRQRPGPVVTWTRDSSHSDGRAVDVRIDGGWSDPRAFARLQQIARDEGLVTLGMRDPGHLELADPEMASPSPVEALRSDMVRPMNTRPSEGALDLTGLQFAPVAEPASPARPRPGIAPVAPVARVAPVPGRGGTLSALPADVSPDAADTGDDGSGRKARAGTGGSTAGQSRGAPPEPAPPDPAPVRTALSDLGAVGQTQGGSAPDLAGYEIARAAEAASEAGGADGIGPTGGLAQSGAAARVNAAQGVQASSVMQRLEQVMALQDKAAAGGPGWRVTMPDADGEGTRVQVGLRGRAVGARLDMKDPAAAAFMRSRAAELAQSLDTRGLDAEQLFVRSAGEVRDPALAARSGGMTVEALRNLAAELSSSGGGHREGQDGQRENAQREPERRSEPDAWRFDDPRSNRDENSQPEDDK